MNSRRQFLKTILFSGLAIATTPLTHLSSAFAELVKDNDPLVKALGYVPKATAAKDRKDKSAKCGNCQFYLAEGKPTGKCQLISSGEVSAEGWCRSYSKRAAAKPAAKKA